MTDQTQEERHLGAEKLGQRTRDRIAEAVIEELLETLQSVVDDILAYEKINNLAPNPPRTYCWDSVARAVALIEKYGPKP